MIDPTELKSPVTNATKNDDWIPLAEAILQQEQMEKPLDGKPLCPSIEENHELSNILYQLIRLRLLSFSGPCSSSRTVD